MKMKVVTAEEMRKIEEQAVKKGLSISNLMERAGKAVAEEAQKMLALKDKGRPVVIVTGKGNNGGDGFVAARNLARKKLKVTLFLLVPPEEIKGEAMAAFKDLKDIPVEKIVLSPKTLTKLERALQEKPVVVDAIFGFGFRGEIKGLAFDTINRLNEYPGPKLSVDVPSGVEATSGRVGRIGVKATRTITFTRPKLGLVVYPGLSYAGEISVADIGIPHNLVERIGRVELVEKQEIARMLPMRPPDVHKKSVGQVLVIAGSLGMTGAAALTAEGALRSGAGLVVLGIPESLNKILEQKLTEVITVPLPETESQTLSEKAYSKIMDLVPNFDVLTLGPGLSQNLETTKLIKKLVKNALCPLVLDADGLNAFREDAAILKERSAPTIVTPHAGELARILKEDSATIQGDRVKYALEAAKKFEVITVLKGARSIVSSPQGATINTTGNSGLASAGTGDVLAGLISGFLAQGAPPYEAAVLGTYLHGLAGDIAAKELTEYCLIASDLFKYLPQAIKQLKVI